MSPPWKKAIIEFDRSPLNRDRLYAFVLGWSDRLTLVQCIDEYIFDVDGYMVFRNADVRPVARSGGELDRYPCTTREGH